MVLLPSRRHLALLAGLAATCQTTALASMVAQRQNASTTPAAAPAPTDDSGDMVLVPDVAACDCGFVDNADTDVNLWTSYYHADFKGMTNDILASGLRALTYSIARESSDFSRSMQPQQVNAALDGLELKVSPSPDGKGIPSAAVSSVNNDFWFGSYHMRGKVSNQTGTVAAFYTYFNDSQEADIEYVAQDKTQHLRYTTKPQHYDTTGRPTSDTYASQMFRSDANPGASISDDYRFWSFRWTPTIVRFGLELNYTAALTHEVPQVPSYLLVAHWSDGNPLFSGGPPASDSIFAVSDIWAIYNSSHAPPTMACKVLTVPCRVDVSKNTVQVPASAAGNITSLPAVPYNSTLVSVNGQAIDWSRGKKHGFAQARWKVITVAVCGGILAILVVACLWNFDGFITRCRNRVKKRDDTASSIFGTLSAGPGGGGPGGPGGPGGAGTGNATGTHRRGASRNAFKVGIVRRMGSTPNDQPGVTPANNAAQQQRGVLQHGQQQPLMSQAAQQPYYEYNAQNLPAHHLFERQQRPLLAGHGPAAAMMAGPRAAAMVPPSQQQQQRLYQQQNAQQQQQRPPHQYRPPPRRPSLPSSPRLQAALATGGGARNHPHAPPSSSHSAPEMPLLGPSATTRSATSHGGGSHESNATTAPSSSSMPSSSGMSEGQYPVLRPQQHAQGHGLEGRASTSEGQPEFMAI